MEYPIDLTIILDSQVSQFNALQILKVDSVVVNTDGTQTITVCDNLHVQEDFTLVINSVNYTVEDFSYKPDTITLSGTGTINAGDIFQMYPVYFFHGTPAVISNELSKEVQADNKTPMIWLDERFTDASTDDNTSVARTVDCDLYIVSQLDSDLWNNQDNYDQSIIPMRRLAENFRTFLKSQISIFSTTKEKGIAMKIDNCTNLTLYSKDQRSKKQLLTDKLSGVKATTHLELYQIRDCDCPIITMPVTVGIGYGAIGIAIIN